MDNFFDYLVVYQPVITQAVKNYGILYRYFARRTTSKDPVDIIEIDETSYNSISNNSLYSTIKMEWKISGQLQDQTTGNNTVIGIITANRKSIALANKTMRGIDHLLLDYQEFRGT